MLIGKGHIGILLLRIFIGSRLIYGVLDNVISWDKMHEFALFLENNNFSMPLLSAILSVYIQLIAGVMVLTGYLIKVASIFIVINFLIALAMVHVPLHDSVEGMTPALAMLFGALTLLFTGADKISLDFYFSNLRKGK